MSLLWLKFKNGVFVMLKDLVIPVFTSFFKDHFQLNVLVEEVPAINPLFMVSIEEDRKKKHLLIIYVNERKGILPILNIYHYDGDGEAYLREMVQKAKRSPEHYTRLLDIFSRVNDKLSVFKIDYAKQEDEIWTLFSSDRVNTVNEFNKLSGESIARFKSSLGSTSISHDFVFTIYDDELYLDLRLEYAVAFKDKILSSHPQLLATNPNFYIDLEKEIYNTTKANIINRVRQRLKETLDPKSVSDADIVRYVQLLEMEKI